jgi:UDP-2,3-diacylglucosamine pyrophosphatase LpxH
VSDLAHNLIVLSDIHLGSDLVHHARPEAPARGKKGERRDRDLVALLEFYRARRQAGRPWRLVIAGDFVDFSGMSVSPSTGLDTEPTSEELAHGLGGAPDHTLAKLHILMRHASPVIDALAAFLAAGHSVIVVRGNHDADWHWEPVQDAFRDELLRRAPFPPERLSFAPWFYYEEGFVYVEHGHQYDAFCSLDHVLHPVSPSDPRRTARSLADILLRYVVRPTRGLGEAGHAAASMLDYLRFAARLGAPGMFSLARRFFFATRALVSLWSEQFSASALRVRKEHERRMRRLSRLQRIGIGRLRRLARLQRAPLTRSLPALLAGVMLDRVATGVLALFGTAAVLSFAPSPAIAWSGVAAVLVLAVVLAVLWRRMRGSLEPSAELRERSARLARLFPAAFIVMGHTHLPETRATDSSTYVNLGAWAEDEAPEGFEQDLPATRTHLVVTRGAERPVAELLAWGDSGPVPYGDSPASSRVIRLLEPGA